MQSVFGKEEIQQRSHCFCGVALFLKWTRKGIADLRLAFVVL